MSRLRALFLAVAVGLGFGVASVATARPGGGQNFHAPTSHSSGGYHAPVYHSPPRSYSHTVGSNYSSSSDEDDSGGGGGMVIFIVFLALVIIIIIAVARSKGRRRAGVAVDANRTAAALAALKAQDPGFDPAAFVERVKKVVAAVNTAWLSGSMAKARRVVSDGVYVRFQTQLALLKQDGLRNAMADWQVVGAQLLAAESDALWDTLHVKVVGAARDADVPVNKSEAEVQQILRGKPLEQYEEVWSFVRRRGAKSKDGVPALDGRCPVCGADVPLAESVRCDYCKSVINSGEHDWVLAEITQPEEWRPQATVEVVPGLDLLRQRDPSVSREELEDRASVVFWKWIEARSTGKTVKLARFTMQPPEAMAQNLELTPAQLREVAVGSSELHWVKPAGDPSMHDRAGVEIVWSANVGGNWQSFTHVFVMARAATARSPQGLSSLDCPVCRGPIGDSDAVRCSFCGEVLHGGAHEWALDGVAQSQT